MTCYSVLTLGNTFFCPFLASGMYLHSFDPLGIQCGARLKSVNGNIKARVDWDLTSDQRRYINLRFGKQPNFP